MDTTIHSPEPERHFSTRPGDDSEKLWSMSNTSMDFPDADSLLSPLLASV